MSSEQLRKTAEKNSTASSSKEPKNKFRLFGLDVFIGGGLVHMRGFPHERLKQEILANTRHPYPAANLEMYIARPAAENGIIGAAIEGWRRIDSQG